MKRAVIGIAISVGIGLIMIPLPIWIIAQWDMHAIAMSRAITGATIEALYRAWSIWGGRIPEVAGMVAGALVLMITVWIARKEKQDIKKPF